MDIALMKAKAATGQAQGSSGLSEVLASRNLPSWVTQVKGFDPATGTLDDVEKLLVNNPSLITNKNEEMLDFIRSRGYTPQWGELGKDEAKRIRDEHMFDRGTKSVAKLHKADKQEYTKEEAIKKLNEGFEEGAGRGLQYRGKEDGQSGFYTKNLAGGVSFIADNSQGEKTVFGADPAGEKRVRELASKWGRLDWMFDPKSRNTLEYQVALDGGDPNKGGGFGRGIEYAAKDVGRVLDTEIVPGFSLSDIPILGQATKAFVGAAEQAGKGISGKDVDWKKFYKDAAGAAGVFAPGLSEIVDVGLGFAEAAETGDWMAAAQNAGRGVMAGLDRSGVGAEFKEFVGDMISDNLQEYGKRALDLVKEKGIDPRAIFDAAKGDIQAGLEKSFESVAEGAALGAKGIVGDLVSQIPGSLPGPVSDIATGFIKDVGSKIDPKAILTDAAKSYGQQVMSGNFDPSAQLKQVGNNIAGAVQSSAQSQLEGAGKQILEQAKKQFDPQQLLKMMVTG
jgi:hypothetical protein